MHLRFGWPLLIATASLWAQNVPGPAPLRYDLRTGDHLVYRQTFEREIDGRAPYGLGERGRGIAATGRQAVSRAEWTVHVIVLSAGEASVVVGMERQRTAAELVRYVAEGKDRLAEERPAFERRARDLAVTADAAVYDPAGVQRTAPSLVREWPSKVLWAVSPIVALPPASAESSGAWTLEGPLGFSGRAADWRNSGAERCLEVRAAATADLLIPRWDAAQDVFRLHYWFCPASGIVTKLEFTGEYPSPYYEKVSERITLELIERRRGENQADWERRPETEQALRSARRLVEVESAPASVPARQVSSPPASDSSGGADAGACAVDSAWTEARIAGRRAPPRLPGTRMYGMSSPRFRGWPYAIRVPDDYRGDTPRPLLIYLGGNTGSAIEAVQAGYAGAAVTNWLVVYPNAAADSWWRDSASAGMTEALVEEVQREYNVDTRRIYLSGLSNGGTGTFYFATLWPHRLSAAVSAMGAGIFLPGVEPDQRPFPNNTANLPMLFLHGEKDRTISPEATRKTVKLMKHRSAPLETHFFPDRGHVLSLGEGEDGLTVRFLQRWSRGTPPRSVRFETRAFRSRYYWVELLDRVGPGVPTGAEAARALAAVLAQSEPASVEAKVDEDNTVTLKTQRVAKLRLLLRRDLLPRAGPVRVRVDGTEVFAGELPPNCKVLARSLEESVDPFLAYDAALVIDVGARRAAPEK